MAPNTSRGQTLIERPKRSRQIANWELAPPLSFALDFALGEYDVMLQIGKDVEYRRNWGAVVESIYKVGEGKTAFHRECRLQAVMLEFLYDDEDETPSTDYSLADRAVDLYLEDPETFFNQLICGDQKRQRLEDEIEESNEYHEDLKSHFHAIEEGYISDLFIDYGKWDTISAKPTWRAGTAIYNSNAGQWVDY